MKKYSRNPLTAPGYNSLIAMVEMAYVRGAWHGKNLNGVLKGVDAGLAHAAVPGRPVTVRQIALHCAYWCYRVRLALGGAARGEFPREGNDWLAQPATADPHLWKADLALLRKEYRLLADLLGEFRDGTKKPAVNGERVEYLVTGAAFHAIYHASQAMQFRRLPGAVVE